MRQSLRPWVSTACVLSLFGAIAATLCTGIAQEKAEKKNDAAVERARREVRLLDDIYKTSIVLVTTHYVKDENGLAAASAFRPLFAAMKEKGWHEARLIDATVSPTTTRICPKRDLKSERFQSFLRVKPLTTKSSPKMGSDISWRPRLFPLLWTNV